MKKTIIYLFIAAALAGCTAGSTTPDAEEPQSTEVAATSAVDKESVGVEETNLPKATATDNTNEADGQNPKPQYLDESDYEGDELGIVKALNLHMKAVYEARGSGGYIMSWDKLDFSEKPDHAFEIPDDIKVVLVEYTEKTFGRNDVEKEKQIFFFRFEDNAWKLEGVADHWI